MGQDTDSEFRRLVQLYRLHLELHKARAQQEQVDNQVGNHGLEAASPDQQLQLLSTWTVDFPLQFPMVKVDCTGRSVLGPLLSRLMIQWSRLLRWPGEGEPLRDDPGIAFIELAVGFMVYAGTYLPVKRPKQDGTLHLFLPESSIDAAANNATLTELSQMMAYWLHQLNQLYSPWVIAPVEHGNCLSLYRLGSKMHANVS